MYLEPPVLQAQGFSTCAVGLHRPRNDEQHGPAGASSTKCCGDFDWCSLYFVLDPPTAPHRDRSYEVDEGVSTTPCWAATAWSTVLCWRAVELTTKALVAGVFLPPVAANPLSPTFVPPSESVSRDKINRIWADVVKEHPYQGLNFQPGGGAVFAGSSMEQLVLIQPPLIQVRELVELDVRRVAQRIQMIFKAIHHHLGGLAQNLGIKLVANAPAPGNDSVAFIRSELLKGDEDAISLAGSLNLDASVKLTMTGPEHVYALSIEPLRSDLTSLFIDLDCQFPGACDLEHTSERVMQADSFMQQQVRAYLESRSEGWAS